MKLIAIDMDGTLLSHDLQISEENLTAIQEAQQQGHIVMICSGRARHDLMRLLERYQLTLPTGTSNGAILHVEDTLLAASYIDKQAVQETVQILETLRFPYKFYTNKGIFAPADWHEKVVRAFRESGTQTHGVTLDDVESITEQQLQAGVIQHFHNVADFLSQADLEIEKFFILTIDEQTRNQLLKQLQEIAHIGITSSAPTNLEVMSEHAHKGFALERMAEHFGIAMEHTVAIGDNFNDVPMLERAGLSIAMGNAEKEVQGLCHAVTLSHNEHGVAHALRAHILKHEEKQQHLDKL